jgi:drug/metabolite transporter (DMT)-like permease
VGQLGEAAIGMSGRHAPDVDSESGQRRDVLRGIGLVTIAMILLPGQDAIAKFISDTVSPGQLSWARFLMQTAFTIPFLLYFQGPQGLVANRFWMNALRGGLIATSSTLFFAALKFMPMADALAIFFIEPFILTILSAVFDKEKVGWRRRIAVTAGFIGVLIVVRPSYAVLGPVSLIPAVGGCCFAVYALLNRRLAAFDTPLTMQFTAGLSALTVLTLVLAFGAKVGIAELSPSAVGSREVAFLFFMGVLGTSGHLLFVQASKLAPSSVIAPMQYVEIAAAALLGFAVFGDFPDFWKWVGIAVIVTSGAYVFWRESLARGQT